MKIWKIHILTDSRLQDLIKQEKTKTRRLSNEQVSGLLYRSHQLMSYAAQMQEVLKSKLKRK